jgi:hypothetical protein
MYGGYRGGMSRGGGVRMNKMMYRAAPTGGAQFKSINSGMDACRAAPMKMMAMKSRAAAPMMRSKGMAMKDNDRSSDEQVMMKKPMAAPRRANASKGMNRSPAREAMLMKSVAAPMMRSM